VAFRIERGGVSSKELLFSNLLHHLIFCPPPLSSLQLPL
jgi:hypothetical protein